jgi:hypothetical protein
MPCQEIRSSTNSMTCHVFTLSYISGVDRSSKLPLGRTEGVAIDPHNELLLNKNMSRYRPCKTSK